MQHGTTEPWNSTISSLSSNKRGVCRTSIEFLYCNYWLSCFISLLTFLLSLHAHLDANLSPCSHGKIYYYRFSTITNCVHAQLCSFFKNNYFSLIIQLFLMNMQTILIIFLPISQTSVRQINWDNNNIPIYLSQNNFFIHVEMQ